MTNDFAKRSWSTVYNFSLLCDGGPSKGPHQEVQASLEGSSSSSKVKVLALFDQLAVLPGLRDMHKPGFDYLLEGDLERVISYAPHLHLA